MASFARSVGAAVWGVESHLVEIEVSVPGMGEAGVFRIVGLGDGALREGRERIRGAILHEGYPWPPGMVTVNLAPASDRKEGPALDLPIALAVLEAAGCLGRPEALGATLCLGELGLDGRVRAVRGALGAAEAARCAKIADALVPAQNAAEVAAVPGLVVRAVDSLDQAVGHLRGTAPLPVAAPRGWRPESESSAVAEVRGQSFAVRAACVAAAGSHNLLLTGPPGSGKTLLARALRGLLPPLTRDEALEVSRVHSAAGLLEDGLVTRRPFRSPHHTTSLAGLVGGGSVPKPGEVSLAHLGVLFLDEFAEFARATLDALRQPVEEGEIVIGRAAGRARLPCDVVLVAAMNPCPCGWKDSGVRDCKCPGQAPDRYRARVSGPLLDRFDLRVAVKAVDPSALADSRPAPVAVEPDRMMVARARQDERARRLGLRRAANARLPGRIVRDAVEPTRAAQDLLVSAVRRLALSARAFHRTLRVARTIADLDDSRRVEVRHVTEALQYRGEDA